jgi:hypothetical protein
MNEIKKLVKKGELNIWLPEMSNITPAIIGCTPVTNNTKEPFLVGRI